MRRRLRRVGEFRGEVGGFRRDGVVGRVRLGDAGLRGGIVNVVEGDAAAGPVPTILDRSTPLACAPCGRAATRRRGRPTARPPPAHYRRWCDGAGATGAGAGSAAAGAGAATVPAGASKSAKAPVRSILDQDDRRLPRLLRPGATRWPRPVVLHLPLHGRLVRLDLRDAIAGAGGLAFYVPPRDHLGLIVGESAGTLLHCAAGARRRLRWASRFAVLRARRQEACASILPRYQAFTCRLVFAGWRAWPRSV